jgi:23S rRNA pseudouridine1911/1915/1917 synthase
MQIQVQQDTSQRLDLFLSQNYPELSRSRAQSLIKEGAVLLNGHSTRPSYVVRPGDRIVVDLPEPAPVAITPEDIPLDILFEDRDLLVVNKAAGMTAHPAPGSWQGTLVNALLFHCRDLSGINGELRPGIVHRLDKNTTGLLVVAKNDRAHRHLAAQLEARLIERRYSALVWGQVTATEGRIDAPIGRHPRDRKIMAVVGNGRKAATHFTTAERFRFLSLLDLKLETGRTHQIRVHLQHYGHPVFGDPAYGGRNRTAGIRPEYRRHAEHLLTLIQRQALHARQLRFTHPSSGSAMDFKADPPADLANLIEAVRQTEPG